MDGTPAIGLLFLILGRLFLIYISPGRPLEDFTAPWLYNGNPPIHTTKVKTPVVIDINNGFRAGQESV